MTESPIDAFALFGIARQYHLDLAELRRRYLQQSRALHPDYHAGATPAEQEAAVLRSSQLNQAYTRLSDPQQRLELLLRLAGLIDYAGQTERKLTPAFMMEVMELGEQAESPNPADRDALRAQLVARLAQLHAEVEALMRQHDGGEAGARAQALEAALDLLLQRRALQRVHEQVG